MVGRARFRDVNGSSTARQTRPRSWDGGPIRLGSRCPGPPAGDEVGRLPDVQLARGSSRADEELRRLKVLDEVGCVAGSAEITTTVLSSAVAKVASTSAATGTPTAEWSGSGIVAASGSPNTVEASSNVTPCLSSFAAAFSGSQSNSTAAEHRHGLRVWSCGYQHRDLRVLAELVERPRRRARSVDGEVVGPLIAAGALFADLHQHVVEQAAGAEAE